MVPSGQTYRLTVPIRGLRIPKEKNPSRPVATHDRVDLIRGVYRDVRMQVGGTLVESYLPEVFEIALSRASIAVG